MCENEGGGWNDKLKDGCVEVRNETEAKMVQNSSAGSNTERQRVTLVTCFCPLKLSEFVTRESFIPVNRFQAKLFG